MYTLSCARKPFSSLKKFPKNSKLKSSLQGDSRQNLYLNSLLEGHWTHSNQKQQSKRKELVYSIPNMSWKTHNRISHSRHFHCVFLIHLYWLAYSETNPVIWLKFYALYTISPWENIRVYRTLIWGFWNEEKLAFQTHTIQISASGRRRYNNRA